MASTSRKGTKKTFTFKKRTVLEDDDDDFDDFKPSKSNPFPSTSSAVTTKKELKASSCPPGDDSDKPCGAETEAAAATDEIIEVEEIGVACRKLSQRSLSSSDQENVDDIQYVCKVSSSSGTSNGEVKASWKDLMGQMQKNQKEALQDSNVKVSFKRGLKQSPKPKGSTSKKAVQSPSTKNPRLGDSSNPKALPIPSVKPLKLEHVQENEICITDDEDEEFIREAELLESSQEALKPQVLKEPIVPKSSKNLAPIFLPASERKAYRVPKPERPTIDRPLRRHKDESLSFLQETSGVPFCVDAFNYGLIPGMEVYFLSHYHSDHYIGLSKKFCKTLVCSRPTGNLVRMKSYVEEKCIRKLCMNKPYIICGSEITLIDANHCPGSVMFIFRLRTGQAILHTGDFRYTPDMLQNPYLDGLRKERVYFTLAEAIGSKVFGNYDKRKILNALENPKFSSLLASDENNAKIHVVPMFSISAKNLQEYLDKRPQFSNIIGIKPSGWQFSSAGSGCSVKTHYGDTVTVVGVPYSEHSSFSELREFVTSLKPKKVQPTVNVVTQRKEEK
ncbi:DNA cross-link repair 1A protein [Orchesella cincta]|uniref:DNA cross-link repair 1A protein n=1 Tax=Orchesella cincta TaxID=48709 RepID=A0A1D2MB63_ORCCI|nr:DNA cross-link repair 1A protein [Orchesella cincta]